MAEHFVLCYPNLGLFAEPLIRTCFLQHKDTPLTSKVKAGSTEAGILDTSNTQICRSIIPLIIEITLPEDTVYHERTKMVAARDISTTVEHTE